MMKLSHSVFVRGLAMSLALTAVTAQALPFAQRSATPLNQANVTPEERMAILDVDGDGFLTAAELSAPILARSQRLFNRVDRNEDGLIDRAEMAAKARYMQGMLAASGAPVGMRAEVAECIAASTGFELPERESAQQRFEQTDSNADGAVDALEIAQAILTTVSTKMAEFDDEGDGLLTAEEFAAMQARKTLIKEAARECITALVGMDMLLR